jgi:hypothetical protein
VTDDVRPSGGHAPPGGADAALLRLRRTLLALIVIVCAGTIVELVLAGHFEDWLQWVPFVLAGFGAAAAWMVYARPTPARLRLLRAAMAAAALGGAIGCVVHAAGNFLFAQETDATASLGALLVEALTGADPLFAPGILVLVGVLGWLASDGIAGPSAGQP